MGCKQQARGVNSGTARPRPTFTSSLSFKPEKRARHVQNVTLAYVLKNEILQHETCSLLTHDFNDIKNLI